MNKNRFEPKERIFKYFLKTFWYIPSDVLQRSVEATIWSNFSFKSPVLEIGIGDGKITNLLFDKNQFIDVGVDINKKGVEEARLAGRYGKAICASAEKMPFHKNSMNTIISNSTFEHIEKDIKALTEVSRVLKRNGLFYITVPHKNLENLILKYETNRDKTKAKQRLARFNKRANHLHYRTLTEWSRTFKRNKMEIIFHSYYFPEQVAIFWYKFFKIITKEIRGKELWSYLSSSKLKRVVPKKMAIYILNNLVLNKMYEESFISNNEEGAQLFMIAKKL